MGRGSDGRLEKGAPYARLPGLSKSARRRFRPWGEPVRLPAGLPAAAVASVRHTLAINAEGRPRSWSEVEDELKEACAATGLLFAPTSPSLATGLPAEAIPTGAPTKRFPTEIQRPDPRAGH
jgi:hypothetical protein